MRGGAIDESALPENGFTIRTAGAQLADLIQINCQNRISGVFRIVSAGQEAYLFFERGRVTYAELGDKSGVDAVAAMLSLRGGVIEPCARPWPSHEPLDISADVLLLRAAQRLDESTRAGERSPELTTQVVRRIRAPAEVETPHAVQTRAAANDIATSTLSQRPPSTGLSLPPPTASSAHTRTALQSQLAELSVVQLSFEGEVLQLKSGATDELADTAFFVYRLGALIAETLALGDCRAVYLHNHDAGLVVFRGKSIVGAAGAVSELGYVLGKAGLAESLDSKAPARASERPAPPGSAAPGPANADSGLRYADGSLAASNDSWPCEALGGTAVSAGDTLALNPQDALPAAATNGPELLSCLRHVRGVIGAYVCTHDGRLLVNAMPLGFPRQELDNTAARVLNLFQSGDESLERCLGCQLRFSEHLLLVSRHEFGLLCVLTKEAPDRALLSVSLRMAARRVQGSVAPAAAVAHPVADPAAFAHAGGNSAGQ